ncbi:hypothetical protein P5704_027645 (plasmid) [Pseudomonas sp. FeN3W]|nr:hypothetical protein P5704_027645 [Pseudomonas sp. FeN3W]
MRRPYRNEDYEPGQKPAQPAQKQQDYTPRSRFRNTEYAEQREDYQDDPNHR